MTIEKLFEKVDNTEHIYTTDYSVNERARALFDVNGECFALITDRSTSDEATSAGWHVRSDSWHQGYLYSKNNPQPVKTVPRQAHLMPSDEYKQIMEGVLKAGEMGDLVDMIKAKTNTPNVKKVEEINLRIGRVYISEGDLMLDRSQP